MPTWRAASVRPDPLLAVPLAGDLLVAQGCPVMSRTSANRQHALDFQAAEANGQVGHVGGTGCCRPAQAWWKRSRIRWLTIRSAVPTSRQLGQLRRHPFGQGGWVLLGHLIRVDRRDGRHACRNREPSSARSGNSGRSPVPHLHLQLQSASEVASPTRPFKLANLPAGRDGGGAMAAMAGGPACRSRGPVAGSPAQSGRLRNPDPDDAGSAVWFCETSGGLPARLRRANAQRTTRVQVTLDEAGRYRFDAGPGGRLVASLEPDTWRIMALERVQSSLLALLASTVPVIPYAIRPGMRWEDVAAGGAARHGVRRIPGAVPRPLLALGHYVCQAMPQAGKALLHRGQICVGRRAGCGERPLSYRASARAGCPRGRISQRAHRVFATFLRAGFAARCGILTTSWRLVRRMLQISALKRRAVT